MLGKIIKVLVTAGQAVTKGMVLVILEAMKMEHSVAASEDGVVTKVAVSEGEQVDSAQVLAVVETGAAPQE
jgi:biotin carboxyl carrier protein